MTALDAPVRRGSLRAARREAERAAHRLVATYRTAVRVVVACGVVGLGAGVSGILADRPLLLLGWPVLVLAACAGWSLVDGCREAPRPLRGTPLHLLLEQPMHVHLAGLAEEIAVRCPTDVRVVPEPAVWLEIDPDQPVLYLGAPLLWHLDIAELDRAMAAPLARMRAVLDAEVRPAMRLAARLDPARLAGDDTPLAGVLIRRVGHRLGSQRQALLDAVHEWADHAVPRALRAGAADSARLYALREVEGLEAARRRAAEEAGVGLHAPGAGAAATLQACVAAGVLDPREPGTTRPALSLLVDAAATDRRLADGIAARGGEHLPLVQRADLPRRVYLDRWRADRDHGLRVVVHLTGRWPRTVAELLAVLARAAVHRSPDPEVVDRVPLLGALLAGRPQRLGVGQLVEPDDAGDRVRHDAVVSMLAAAVRVAAVEQDRLALAWDDVWGAQLLDADGTPVPVDSFVDDAVARRETRALRAWLAEAGIDVDEPWAGAEPPSDGLDELPVAAFSARCGRSDVDVAVLDGWLLGFPPDRRPVRGLIGAPRTDSVTELLQLAGSHRDRLADVAEPSMSTRLVDVTAGRLDGGSSGRGWTLDLEVPGRTLALAGAGRVAPIGDILRPSLGDRLACTGTARAHLPTRSRAASWWRYVAELAAVLTLAVGVAAVLGLPGAAYLPGLGAHDRALTVLTVGSALVLVARAGQARADRALRRRGDPPRLPVLRARRADGD